MPDTDTNNVASPAPSSAQESSSPEYNRDKDIAFIQNLADSVNKINKPSEKPQLEHNQGNSENVLNSAIRGIAPTAIASGLGAVAGLPAGMPLQGAKMAAGIPAYGDMMVNSLNSVLKTHYTTPTDAITHLLDKAGYEEPRTHAEKIAYQFSRGGAEAIGAATSAGGVGEMAYLANSPIVKGVIAALAQNPKAQAAVGGILQGGGEAVKQAGGGTAAQVGIPLASVIAGGGVKAALNSGGKALEGIAPTIVKAIEGNENARNALASAAAPDPRLAKAAQALKLTNLPPELLTKNPQYQAAAGIIGSTPSSLTALRQVEALQGIGDQAQKLIRDLGGTTDLSQLNQDVRSKMMDTKRQLEDQANTLYGVLDESFDKSTASPARNALQAVQERLALLGGDEKDLSPIEKRIYTALRPQMRGASTKIQQPSYELLDTIRREVGDAIRQTGPFKDEVSGNAKRYYGLLSEDQNKVLEANKLGKIAEMARASVKSRKELEDKIVGLFGNEVDKSITPGLTEGVNALSRGNADNFVNLMANVPPDMKQQVAVSGLNSAFGKATANGSLNFNTYAKWYEGIKKNSAAYKALADNLPKGATDQLENLYLISKNVNKATNKQIRTGLLSSAELSNAPESLVSRVRNAAKQAAVGTALGSVANMFGGHGLGYELTGALLGATHGMAGKTRNMLPAADEFLMSPDFQKLVNASTANPDAFRKVASSISKSPSFVKYANAIGIPVAQRANFFINLAADSKSQQQNQ
jgi:hypothetical protein